MDEVRSLGLPLTEALQYSSVKPLVPSHTTSPDQVPANIFGSSTKTFKVLSRKSQESLSG
jgi:hypothetical protein